MFGIWDSIMELWDLSERGSGGEGKGGEKELDGETETKSNESI